MKNFTSLVLLILVTSVFSNQIKAQNGYNYTLIHDGGYDFTIAAVPNFDSGAFQPITESYGFVIVLPDGMAATFNLYLPAGTSGTPTAIDGSALGALDPAMSDNELYLVTTTTNAATFAAHADGAIIPLVSLTVTGSPTSGELSILSNDSVLVTNYAPLESFMQVDVIDNGTVVFANGIVPGSGLTGTTNFMFSTLIVEQVVLEDNSITVYPNPASDFLQIATSYQIQQVDIFDILGKKVMQVASTNKINVEQLQTGIYLVRVFTDKGQITKKIVIE